MAYLSGFGLENFRVFKDYTWFDFAPITILVGPNSSGKSSLIKALLLLGDNFKKKQIPHDDNEWLMGHRELINFGGRKHNIQNERSIIPHDSKEGEVKFCLPYEGFPLSNPFSQPVFWERSYQIKDQSLYPGIVTKLRTKAQDLFISDHNKSYGFVNTLLLKNILLSNGDAAIKSIVNRDRNIRDLPKIFINDDLDLDFYIPGINDLKQILEHIPLGVIEGAWNWMPWPNNDNLLKALIEKVSDENAYKIAELTNRVLKLKSSQPAFSNWENNIYIPSIKGLPKRYLRFNDDSEVLNTLFNHLKSSRNEQEKHANHFVSKWEKAFGFKSAINWEKDIDLGLTKIRIGDAYLSDLGFGISQLVAILLANYCTDSEEGEPNLLLLEEPEANLHPAFQSKLADMFVDAEKVIGHQFIIETHSEYMIRKFQYLVAKGELKPEDIVIHYFHDPDNVPVGEKQVKKINILEDGSLSDDFGPGFFDEAATWELELLKLKKSKARQN